MTTDTGFRRHTNTGRMRLTVVLFVLLLALESPLPSAARFAVWRRSEHVTARGDLEDGMALELMQYHHVDSPYATPNLTLAQRIDIAVKSSQERAQFFHTQVYGTNSTRFGSDLAISSPLFSAQGSYVMQLNLGTPSRYSTSL